MKPTEMKRLVALVNELSREERRQIKRAIKASENEDEKALSLKKQVESVHCCHHCGSEAYAPWGSKDGRKRFKCKDCGKTFNAMTGTPLARLKMVEKHKANAQCMIDGLSVRKAAEHLGISVPTAFRWRHRFLESIQGIQPEMLSGIVEADETFFLESFKGQRNNLPRPAKKRGTPAQKAGLSKEQIPVLVARDRSGGATLTAKLPSRKAKDIGAALVPKLSKDAVLFADGAHAYKTIGKNNGIEVRSIPVKPNKKTFGPNHINNVNAYDSRLHGWMFRFKGVATKYLPSYLGWHRWLDRVGPKAKSKQFLASALG